MRLDSVQVSTALFAGLDCEVGTVLGEEASHPPDDVRLTNFQGVQEVSIRAVS